MFLKKISRSARSLLSREFTNWHRPLQFLLASHEEAMSLQQLKARASEASNDKHFLCYPDHQLQPTCSNTTTSYRRTNLDMKVVKGSGQPKAIAADLK